jgi:hypothetical protein
MKIQGCPVAVWRSCSFFRTSMPAPLAVILTALIFVVLNITCSESAVSDTAPYVLVSTWQDRRRLQPHSPREEDPLLIVAGVRVGPIRLNDSRQKVLKVLPRKADIDREYDYPNCGTTYSWLDPGTSGGSMDIRFNRDRVFQIDASGRGYHTTEGLTEISSPEQIRRSYPELQAYTITGTASEAVGRRDLVIWVQQDGGIAFTFAFDNKRQRRSLYKITVFKPKSQFCPEGYSIESPELKSLAPFSLEPGAEKVIANP